MLAGASAPSLAATERTTAERTTAEDSPAPLAVDPKGDATKARLDPPDPPQRECTRELEEARNYLQAGEKANEDEERRENYEQATHHAERAVQLCPNDADAHFILFGSKGRVAQMGGIATAALELASLNRELDEVLRLNPDHADALAARGGMLVKLPRLLGGNTTEGIRYLERATVINPNGAGTRLELAEAYEIVGREADAWRVGREAIAIAERKGESKKAARARKFIEELEESCPECTRETTPR